MTNHILLEDNSRKMRCINDLIKNLLVQIMKFDLKKIYINQKKY